MHILRDKRHEMGQFRLSFEECKIVQVSMSNSLFALIVWVTIA